MKITTLLKAIGEAEHFLEAAKAAHQQFYIDWEVDSKRLGLKHPQVYTNTSKRNASCKRASMDLTRILADLRQGR